MGIVKELHNSKFNESLADFVAYTVETKNPVSSYALGLSFLEASEFYESCYALAVYYLTIAGEAGYSDAQLKLGLMYLDGDDKDVEMAFRWLIRAASQNDCVAQYEIALLILDNDVIGSDIEQGIKWATLSANQNYSDAQLLLSELYSDGRVLEPDHDKFMHYLSMAAENLHPEAMASLGAILMTSEKDDDVKRGRHLIAESAESEYCYNGVLLHNMLLLNEDLSKEEATICFDKIQQNMVMGHAPSAIYLAEAYLQSRYLKSDPTKALKYFMAAESIGSAEAEYRIGQFYATGEVLQKNLDAAKRYLGKAAEKGHAQADILLDSLMKEESQISPSE